MPYCPDHMHAGTYRKKSGPHLGEYCSECNRCIQWVPQTLSEFIWPIGSKHKGDTLSKIAETDPDYLRWAAENLSSPSLKKKAQQALTTLIPGSTTTGSTYQEPAGPSPKQQISPSNDNNTENEENTDDVPW